MKKYLSLTIVVFVLAIFAWYGATHRDIFAALGHVALWTLIVIALLRLLRFFLNGLFTKITAEAFTNKFTIRESYMISIITAVGNFFGPLFGGLGLRALYLKKFHNLPIGKFTSTLVGYYLIMFMVNSLLAIGSILALSRTAQTGYLIVFFGVWFVALAGLAFVRLPKNAAKLKFFNSSRPGKLIYKLLREVDDGWRTLLADRVLMVKLVALTVVTLAVTFTMIYFEFVALGINGGWAAVGLYTALTQVAILLSVTPDNVGFREAILLLVATTIGVGSAEIVQISVIDRGIQFILLLLLLPVANGLRRQIKLRKPAASN